MTSSSSSINDLPFELLADIFDLSVERGRFGTKCHAFQYQFHRQAAPFNLIGVCRLWRFWALRTPNLWDSFSFHAGQTQSLLRGWLGLNPDAPFRLSTPSCHPIKQAETARVCSHFRLFCEVYNRWKSLSIELDPSMAQELLSFLQKADLATLHLNNLEMIFRHLAPTSSEKTISSIISYLPSISSLQHLTINISCPFETTLQELDILWSQYQTIRIHHPNAVVEQVVWCLSRCTAATNVRFQSRVYNCLSPSLRPYDPPFSLDSLTTLNLGRGVDPINVISHFSLPNLRELFIDVHERNHAALESFLSRAPSLHTLIIGESLRPYYGFIGATDEDLVAWLCSVYLRPLPCFQLYIQTVVFRQKGIEILGRELIEQSSEAGVAFPPLACFQGDDGFKFIGWGDDLQDRREVFWTYKDGIFQ